MSLRRAPLRLAWAAGGVIALALGIAGMALPLLPTVPFLLLAAFCFARSNPAWEAWLLDHPRFGPPIRAWRARRAIGRRAKVAAVFALTFSAGLGLAMLSAPWSYAPLAAALIVGSWIVTRPS